MKCRPFLSPDLRVRYPRKLTYEFFSDLLGSDLEPKVYKLQLVLYREYFASLRVQIRI
jgi:hypothetical protein